MWRGGGEVTVYTLLNESMGHIHINKLWHNFWTLLRQCICDKIHMLSSFRSSREAAAEAAHFRILWTVLLTAALVAQNITMAVGQEACKVEGWEWTVEEQRRGSCNSRKTWREVKAIAWSSVMMQLREGPVPVLRSGATGNWLNSSRMEICMTDRHRAATKGVHM